MTIKSKNKIMSSTETVLIHINITIISWTFEIILKY